MAVREVIAQQAAEAICWQMFGTYTGANEPAPTTSQAAGLLVAHPGVLWWATPKHAPQGPVLAYNHQLMMWQVTPSPGAEDELCPSPRAVAVAVARIVLREALGNKELARRLAACYLRPCEYTPQGVCTLWVPRAKPGDKIRTDYVEIMHEGDGLRVDIPGASVLATHAQIDEDGESLCLAICRLVLEAIA